MVEKSEWVIPPYERCRVYLLRAVTPIHAGCGRSVTHVADLPIQRNALEIPIIYGSSIKGALRSMFRLSKKEKKEGEKGEKGVSDEDVIFGPEPGKDPKFAGALTVLDAVLTLIPAPSLYGVYAYATSVPMLEALRDYLRLAAEAGGSDEARRLAEVIDKVICKALERDKEGACLVSKNSKVAREGKAFVAYTSFDAEESEEVSELERELAKYGNLRDVVGRVVVALGSAAVSFINRCTEIVTRVRLEPTTKTVAKGALWSEEYLPRKSVLATVFMYARPRANSTKLKTAKDVEKAVEEVILRKKYLILGGDETIGKGVVELIEIGGGTK